MTRKQARFSLKSKMHKHKTELLEYSSPPLCDRPFCQAAAVTEEGWQCTRGGGIFILNVRPSARLWQSHRNRGNCWTGGVTYHGDHCITGKYRIHDLQSASIHQLQMCHHHFTGNNSLEMCVSPEVGDFMLRSIITNVLLLPSEQREFGVGEHDEFLHLSIARQTSANCPKHPQCSH